jgi:hypothetical protein
VIAVKTYMESGIVATLYFKLALPGAELSASIPVVFPREGVQVLTHNAVSITQIVQPLLSHCMEYANLAATQRLTSLRISRHKCIFKIVFSII